MGGLSSFGKTIFGGGGEGGAKKASEAMTKYGDILTKQAPLVGATADPFSEYRQNAANMLNSLITGTTYNMPTQQAAYDPSLLDAPTATINMTKKQKKLAKKADKQLASIIDAGGNSKKSKKAEKELTKTLNSLGMSNVNINDLKQGYTSGSFSSIKQVYRNNIKQQASTSPPIATNPTTSPSAAAPETTPYQWQTDPGYKFRLDEANREVERAMSARGYNESGNILNAITQRTQDVASSEYQNIINRLINVSGASGANAPVGAQAYTDLYTTGQGAKYGSQYNYNMFKANNDTGLWGTVNKVAGTIDTISGAKDSFKNIFG